MKATPNFWKYLALLLASMGITLSEAGVIDIVPNGPPITFDFTDMKPGDLRFVLTQLR